MKNNSTFAVLAAFIGLLSVNGGLANAQGGFPSTKSTNQANLKNRVPLFADDVQALVEADKRNPPQPNGIVFIGGNVFVQWRSATSLLASVPAYNKSFGGARSWEMLAYIDKLIMPLDPAVVIYYGGSNDLNDGDLPDTIARNFKLFCATVHALNHQTRVLFVSIIKAPQKMSHWQDVELTNSTIKAYCADNSWLAYVDINSMFFKRLGQPRMEMFLDDGVNLAPGAYDEMGKLLLPAINKAYREATNAKNADNKKKEKHS